MKTEDLYTEKKRFKKQSIYQNLPDLLPEQRNCEFLPHQRSSVKNIPHFETHDAKVFFGGEKFMK